MSSIFHEQLLERVTPEDTAFVRMSINIVKRIHELMRAKNLTQADLADVLELSPFEMDKWLSGMHNFTLKSLAKLEIVLGAPVIAQVVVKPQTIVERLEAIIADLSSLKEEQLEKAVA